MDISEKDCVVSLPATSSDVNPGICIIVKTCSYIDIQKFSNLWCVGILKNLGVMKQIPGMTSLPSSLNNIFGRQDILQFFADVSKYYKYVKSPKCR